jgi:hypothetical protein
MALQLTVATIYGDNATYWAIDTTLIDYHQSVAQASVGGYLTSAAKAAGARPLITRTHNRAVANPDAVTRTNIYTFLKTLPEYAGAIDVAEV